MTIKVLETAGRASAAAGLGLSYDKPVMDDADFQRRALTILDRRSTSEAKFMRQMVAWLRITAPRYWWQEFATYRIGVEVQSASTMHTILKRPLEPADFEGATGDGWTTAWEFIVGELNKRRVAKDWLGLKQALPESFLQTRVVMCSYQALRAMYIDRHQHRLPEWLAFCDCISSDRLPESYLITYATT